MTISARSHSQDSNRETHNSGHDTGEGCAKVTLSFSQSISDW